MVVLVAGLLLGAVVMETLVEVVGLSGGSASDRKKYFTTTHINK